MTGFLDAGDKVASIAGSLIALAALIVSIIALQRDRRSASPGDRNPVVLPQNQPRANVAGFESETPLLGGAQRRTTEGRLGLAVGLMAGAILFFVLATQVVPALPMDQLNPEDVVIGLVQMLWWSSGLALGATTVMVLVTRGRPGRRLIPGAVSVFFALLTAMAVYFSVSGSLYVIDVF